MAYPFLVTALRQAAKSVEAQRSPISNRNIQVIDLSNASELVQATASAVLMSVVQAAAIHDLPLEYQYDSRMTVHLVSGCTHQSQIGFSYTKSPFPSYTVNEDIEMRM